MAPGLTLLHGGDEVSHNAENDYYEVLQVSRNADFETIERVFRLLAKRYHPDNVLTGDESRFRGVVEAYRVLCDPEKRAAYDAGNEGRQAGRWKIFYEPAQSSDGFDADLRLRQGILSILYTARKRDVSRPGVGGVVLENLLGCPQQLVEFHLWYLKEKGLIQRTDTGEFAITVSGVDEISSRRLPERNRLTVLPAEAGEHNGEGNGPAVK